MIKNKNFFVDHKDQIEEENKSYEAHSESKTIPTEKCDHIGKVKAVPGGVRCRCGAMWTGKNVDSLLTHFMSVIQ